MSVAEWVGIISAGSGLLGGSGFFVARATARAAEATARANRAAATAMAEPAQRQADLAVLKETVSRVDGENREQRARLARLEAVLRAFARTADRWAAQMRRAGIEPEPPEPLVEEYYRTGV